MGLTLGEQGETVQKVQTLLSKYGYLSAYNVTSYYGEVTEKAVKEFQKQNGSATVALMTGSAIVLPLMPALGLSPVIATLSIAAGSSFFYHANASHFWVVLKSNDDLPMGEGYELVSVATALGSIAAMLSVWIMSMFIHV